MAPGEHGNTERPNALMYPHKDNFMDVMKEYIDFSDNEELWKEAANMGGLGQSILEEGIEQGEDRLGKLMNILLAHNRTDDMRKAAVDKEVRRRLYEEFHI